MIGHNYSQFSLSLCSTGSTTHSSSFSFSLCLFVRLSVCLEYLSSAMTDWLESVLHMHSVKWAGVGGSSLSSFVISLFWVGKFFKSPILESKFCLHCNCAYERHFSHLIGRLLYLTKMRSKEFLSTKTQFILNIKQIIHACSGIRDSPHTAYGDRYSL